MQLLIAHSSSTAQGALADVASENRDSLEILTSDNGLHTLDLLLSEEPPDVALVDWDLPGVEGPEMCRLVRDFHRGRRTYLVVLGSASVHDMTDAWRAGADDCVCTPAPADALLECMEKGLRSARARRASDAGSSAQRGRPGLEALRTQAGFEAPRTPDGDVARASIAACLCSTKDPLSGGFDAAAREDESRGPARLEALLYQQ